MQCINDFRSFRNPLGELWFISGQALLVLAHGSPDLLLMDLEGCVVVWPATVLEVIVHNERLKFNV